MVMGYLSIKREEESLGRISSTHAHTRGSREIEKERERGERKKTKPYIENHSSWLIQTMAEPYSCMVKPQSRPPLTWRSHRQSLPLARKLPQALADTFFCLREEKLKC